MRSMANGNGQSGGNSPDIRTGSPVPPLYRDWEFLTARATTFWELI